MKIYINDFTTPVKAEVLPSNAPTLDETLETFSFALLSTDKSLGASKIAPMQKVKVEFENATNDVAYFYIVSDSVEIFSINPVRYKHNISCIQNTRELSKHLVRNSSFTQPAQPIKESSISIMGIYDFYSSPKFRPYYNDFWTWQDNLSQSLILNAKEKIKTLKVRFELHTAIFNYDSNDIDDSTVTWNENAKTFDDLVFPGGTNPSFFNTVRLQYQIGQTTSTINLTPSTLFKNGVALSEFEFNQDLECPTIVNLINNNSATNIKILLGQDVAPINQQMPIQCLNMSKDASLNGCVVNYILNIKIIAETYYYNCYDILQLLIRRQQKSTSIKTDAPLFALPNSGELYNLLKNTITPNFYFTQLTMYECVADVFRLFDAIFNMDENGVLGIEYFNDLSGEIITPKLTGKNESISEDKYTNGLITEFQDARVEETFPTNKTFGGLRSSELGVPADKDHFFIVPHPIQSIKKCELKVSIPAYYIDSAIMTDYPEWKATNLIDLDITKYVIEDSIWSLLPISQSVPASWYLYQINTITFTKGDNKINVGGTDKFWLEGTVYSFNYMRESAISLFIGSYPLRNTPGGVPSWSEIAMRLTYLSSVDGRLKIESLENKYNGETLVDQANGAVDLNKLGLNILGLSLKLGQPTLNATHKITTWDNRIKVGQIYNYEGGTWIANVCSYTLLGNGYLQGQVSFVKNFNQLALRTQILREKRMSNISKELITKSEDIICDYLYISSEFKSLVGENVHFNKNYVYSAIKNSFKNDDSLKKPGLSTIHTNEVPERRAAYASSGTIIEESPGWRSELNITVPFLLQYPLRKIKVTLNGQPYDHYSYTQGTNYVSFVINALDERDFDYILIEIFCYKAWDGIYLPLVKYGAGNTLCFEFSYDSPISAGNQTQIKSGWFGNDKYYTIAFKYTDDEGFKDEFEIHLMAETDAPYIIGDTFPNVPVQIGNETEIINIYNYDVYKQPNEIFALNYEIVLLAVDYTVDFIGSKLVNENFLVTSETPINQELRLYYTTDSDDDSFQYSVLDTEGHEGHYTAITSVSQSGTTVTFNFSAITNLKTWAICDSKGKIYFASNRAFSGSKSSVVLYLYARNSRIE